MGNNRFLQIDPDGYLMSSGLRLADETYGRDVLSNLQIENRIYRTLAQNSDMAVLPFDAPLVATNIVDISQESLILQLPYSLQISVDPARLCADPWDRFHGFTQNNIPFVLSRAAQAALFNKAESFDDDSITIAGNKYEIGPMRMNLPEASTEDFWSNKYKDWKSTGEKPGFDLEGPHPALPDILKQLKLSKMRIAVLGAGPGHDANYFAEQGHLVTAFDISPDAVERAKANYPESENLQYRQVDALNLPNEFHGQFDLVFEHTFFCAINPEDRQKVIHAYKKLLSDEGHLLGIFFMITPSEKPPFGATEWELRERFRKHFDLLYWTRPEINPSGRDHWELVVYAKKKAP